jgi:sulfate adenylyltransferase (ADP) / ATP adenylyltransferase
VTPAPGRRLAFAQGSLWPAIRARSASALAAGVLEPIETRVEVLEAAGIDFQLRVVSSGARKAKAKAERPADFDPFLPWDPALFVCDVNDAYVCLLNRFPALRHHALLTTRAFEEQEAPLGPRDFEAVWGCLGERDALAFYNAGPLAGASERHRHFQLVPPLVAGAYTTPLDAALEEARFDGPLGRAPGLRFLHGLARLRELSQLSGAEAGAALAALYREMARAFACDQSGRPYNLLLTREWMLFVPRARDGWQGVPVNALGFAGTLLLRDDAALERVRAAGPMAVLSHVGVAG